ncbi:MAG: thioredoxin family protein, partial [Caulobacterales bacterium]
MALLSAGWLAGFGVAQAAGPTAVIPALRLQLPESRVGWTFGDVGGPLRAANADGQPVVLMAVAPGCSACQALLANAARCPAFNALAGHAHFAMVDARSADAVVRSLNVGPYPAVLVLGVRGGGFSERARGVGYMDEDALMTVLARGGLWSRSPVRAAGAASTLGTYAP